MKLIFILFGGEINIKHWQIFNYKNKSYCLDHLDEIYYVFNHKSKDGKPDIFYPFLIEFGLHCFTRGLNPHRNESLHQIDKELIYYDSREGRIFDFDRYQLSKSLPEITKKISEKSCFHTGKENFFIIEIINDQGVLQDYEIYFKITRARNGVLRLFVQSAYIRDSDHKSSQPKKKKISFFVIAHHVQKNKPIKIPP